MSERSYKSQSTQRYEVTDAYREAHAAIFGDAKPQRGRWVYDKAKRAMVPESEYVAPEAMDTFGHVPIVSDLYMDGDRATDGTDIGSRPKRREYMKREGLADASDYSGNAWPKAKQRRAEFFAGRDPDIRRQIKETVGRLAYQLQTQRGRKR